MSKYTTQVRFICEEAAGLTKSVGFDTIDTVLETAAEKVFNFSYPIWDTAYKKTLDKAILMAYYTREIGEETVGLWKLRVRQVLERVMPYYNQLYLSTMWEFDPLYDVNYTTKRDSTTTGKNVFSEERHNVGDNTININGTNTTTTSQDTHSENMYSDTPQGELTNVRSGSYLTNATVDDVGVDGTVKQTTTNKTVGNSEDTTDTNSTRNTDDVLDFLETVKGYKQYPVDLLLKWREAIVNINDMIIAELADCFFGLWL